MRRVWSAVIFYSLLLAFFQFGCAGASVQPAADAAIGTVQLVSLAPSTVVAGNGPFLLEVNGSNFSTTSRILWNGANLATSFVSPGRLTTQVPLADVSQASQVTVAVQNPASGHTSNSLFLTVRQPLTISTAELPAGTTGGAYSAPVSASGGLSPYRFSISSGSLPAGLAINTQSGMISGSTTTSGSYSFTVWVTDANNTSAQANLNITVAPAGASTVAAGGAGKFYGPGLGSDGLANTAVGPFGNTVSYRFRAKHSGALENAIVYLIPDHPGYAGGTGGTIQVTIHTDDGSAAHGPSSTILATYMMTNVLSLSSPARYFYVMNFSTPPTLAAGQLYHMVFKNVDALPLVNFLSVDALYQVTFSSNYQPTIPNNDEAVLLSNGGAWSPRPGYTPIYELEFSNGATEGIGYIEAWVGAPEPVSGTTAVREAITVSGAQENVTSVSLRMARTGGNDPLVIRLEDVTGALVEQGSIPAAEIPESSATAPLYYWATYTFSAAHPLLPGATYHLDLEASSTSTYQTFPIRKGAAYGFSDSTFYTDGHAEFKAGDSWTGWTQWGVSGRTDGDLQFYFTAQ